MSLVAVMQRRAGNKAVDEIEGATIARNNGGDPKRSFTNPASVSGRPQPRSRRPNEVRNAGTAANMRPTANT